MKFDIISIFPEFFDSFKSQALIARAQEKPAIRTGGSASPGGGKIISINTHDLRDCGEGPHRKVDDRPYGGGAGMVLMPTPIAKALASVKRKAKSEKRRIIVFSAKGKVFNQATARRYAKLDQLIMICGRYEGIDERVTQYLADEEVSVGEFVLFGGEVPAMVVMEAVTRLLPGALGKPESLKEESYSSFGIRHSSFLEYPHYTRPEVFQKHKVPPVLLSGNHAKIKEWRKEKTKMKTEFKK